MLPLAYSAMRAIPLASQFARPLRRRMVIGGSIALATMAEGSARGAVQNAAGGASPASARAGGSYFAYTGCRTTRERNARGDGINVYRVDAPSGRWTHVQLLAGLVNPSFLAIDAAGRTLYTVHGDSSEVSSFRIDAEAGRIAPLNTQFTRGKNPVHLAIDPTGRFLVVTNHVTAGELK